jgi:ligand-binding sensor domain-containing protein
MYKSDNMQKTKILKNFGSVALIISLLLTAVSCEKTKYDLLDPEDAGVWTLFNTSDGLPGNTVSDIQLDKRNNLWFTFPGQGCAKYSDGVWTNYRITNSPLLSNNVSCLAESAEGSIIFGTSTGLSILSSSDTWDSYIDPVNTIIVTAVKVASDGSVWIGTSNQGVFVNRGSGYVKTMADLEKTIINVIEEDHSGNLWIGTENGLVRWNGSSAVWFLPVDGLPNNRISAIRHDSKMRLWIGTRAGKNVAWIDDKGIHDLSLLTGRDTCMVNDIFEDRRGNIWFATTNDGLICYDGIMPRAYKINNGLPENTIRCIGEDESGNLWFGLESKGVARYTLPLD